MNNPTALPWWQSKVIVGALVGLVSMILVAFGLVDEIAAADQEKLVEAVVGAAGAIGSIVAIVARVRQRQAPPISAGRSGGRPGG